jgi:hypothetical protein
LLLSAVFLFGESELLQLLVPLDLFSTAQGRVTNMGRPRGSHAWK